jgi:hypothetical protein
MLGMVRAFVWFCDHNAYAIVHFDHWRNRYAFAYITIFVFTTPVVPYP